MAIEISCAACGKDFRVKDEMAGRKFRCSGCQATVPIPAAKSGDDPWELSDEDYGEAIPDPKDEEESRPTPRKKKRTTRKSRSSDSMPAPVIIAMTCTGVMFCVIILALLGSVIDPDGRKNIIPLLVRLGFNVQIFFGLMNRKSSSRTSSIVLSVLGLIFVGFVFFAAADKLTGGVDGIALQVAVAILVLQGILWTTNIIALLTPSASEWCTE